MPGRKPPWKKSNPRKKAGKASRKMSAGKTTAAKTRAKNAGRRYPNLVDNMWAASHATKGKRKTSKRKTPKRKTSKGKSPARKTAAKRER